MEKSKVTSKDEGARSGARWVVMLSIGIVVGGTTLALERILDLSRSMLLDTIVGASLLTVLISFIGFMSRFRE